MGKNIENIGMEEDQNAFVTRERFMPQEDECVFKKCCKKYKKKGRHCKKCPKL